MLIARKNEQDELKALFGDEYTDYGMVFCSLLGPCIEGQVINRALNKLITENNLPKVVCHSLRHSSITYKLKLNGGDMKSVQGDSGHQTEVQPEKQVAETTQAAGTADSDQELLMRLLKNPQMATILKTLA